MLLADTNKILLYNKTTDMRKSINGLSIIISQELEENPTDGGMYVFYNKQYDKIKILYWYKNGFSLLYRRLEKKRFKLGQIIDKKMISYAELVMIFEGVDIKKVRRFKSLKYSRFT